MILTTTEGARALLRVENIKLAPGSDMGALAAETARLLKVREKDLLSLRVLRRSVDAREGVCLVYTVEAAVKEVPQKSPQDRSHRPLPPARPSAGAGCAAGGGGRGTGGALRRFGPGPGGPAAHPAGAGPGRGTA